MSAVERLPFGGGDPRKRRASFVALTARVAVYEGYGDPAVDESLRVPLALMVHRWDGRLGFPGGLIEAGRPSREEAARELYEEAGHRLRPEDLLPMATHDAGAVVVDLWWRDLGDVGVHTARGVLAAAACAPHALAEGCATWVHLAHYGRGRGLARLLGGALAPAVAEELAALCEALGVEPPR